MGKKLIPGLGEVYERAFPQVAAAPGLLARLEKAREAGQIKDYAFKSDSLTLLRPWLSGKTVEEQLAETAIHERFDFSVQLFRRVSKLLIAKGHGAIHARNILLRAGMGLDLLDASFNSMLLTPWTVKKEDIWCWGSGKPKKWSLQDWDRVCLLRTATIVGTEHLEFSTRPTNQEMKILCRNWASRARREAGLSDVEDVELLAALDNAVGLLLNIPEKIECPAPASWRGLVESQEHGREEISRDSPADSNADVVNGHISHREGPNEIGGGSQLVGKQGAAVLPEGEVVENSEPGGGKAKKQQDSAKLSNSSSNLAAGILTVVVALITWLLPPVQGALDRDGKDLVEKIFGAEGPEIVNFSELINGDHADPNVVYIFVLDISDSFKKSVSAARRDGFKNRLVSDGLWREDDAVGSKYLEWRCGLNGDGVGDWHLARALTCFYIGRLPGKTRAGLWVFGTETTRLGNSRAYEIRSNIAVTEDGGKKQLIDLLMDESLEPEGKRSQHTDFVRLFEGINHAYGTEGGFVDADLRLVVVSDFVHDTSLSNDPDRYTKDKERICGLVKELSKLEISYRMIAIGGETSDEDDEESSKSPNSSNFLKFIKSCTESGQFRGDKILREAGEKRPDFLFDIEPAERPITIRQEMKARGKWNAVKLTWDLKSKDRKAVGVYVRIEAGRELTSGGYQFYISKGNLAKNVECEEQPPKPGRPGGYPEGVVVTTGVLYEFKMDVGDHLCVSAPRDADYRDLQLHLSTEEDRAKQSVHSVEIEFDKYYPRWVVNVVLAILTALVLLLVWVPMKFIAVKGVQVVARWTGKFIED